MENPQITPIDEFTQEQIDNYVESKGARCPYCHKTGVYYNDRLHLLSSTFNYTFVKCGNCDRKWVEVYKLAFITAKQAFSELLDRVLNG